MVYMASKILCFLGLFLEPCICGIRTVHLWGLPYPTVWTVVLIADWNVSEAPAYCTSDPSVQITERRGRPIDPWGGECIRFVHLHLIASEALKSLWNKGHHSSGVQSRDEAGPLPYWLVIPRGGGGGNESAVRRWISSSLNPIRHPQIRSGAKVLFLSQSWWAGNYFLGRLKPPHLWATHCLSVDVIDLGEGGLGESEKKVPKREIYSTCKLGVLLRVCIERCGRRV